MLLIAAIAGSEEHKAMPLWGDAEPPYAKAHNLEEYLDEDCWGNVPCLHQVVNPTLTLYLPEGKPNGTAVVILPGGGYTVEAVYHEGYEIAELLAAQGTVAAVVKYRLPNPESSTHPWLVPELDTRRALKLLRESICTSSIR